jgi:hypothetical protein
MMVQGAIVRQYLLYEVPHRDEKGNEEARSLPQVPKAHTPADIYKCLHQGEFSIGHSIDDPVTFGNNLANDLLQARPSGNEPILEDVSLDGSVFRINLRPYRQRFKEDENAACALLLKACLESAENVRGSGERFLGTLARFRDLNHSHSLVANGVIYAFPPDMVDAFLMEVADFIQQHNTVPVLSHSVEYKRLNHPSYRVLDLETLEKSELACLVNPVS